MPRHDRAYGVWHQAARGGKVPGKGEMKRRRRALGITREEFAALLRRLGIRGRGA